MFIRCFFTSAKSQPNVSYKNTHVSYKKSVAPNVHNTMNGGYSLLLLFSSQNESKQYRCPMKEYSQSLLVTLLNVAWRSTLMFKNEKKV